MVLKVKNEFLVIDAKAAYPVRIKGPQLEMYAKRRRQHYEEKTAPVKKAKGKWVIPLTNQPLEVSIKNGPWEEYFLPRPMQSTSYYVMEGEAGISYHEALQIYQALSHLVGVKERPHIHIYPSYAFPSEWSGLYLNGHIYVINERLLGNFAQAVLLHELGHHLYNYLAFSENQVIGMAVAWVRLAPDWKKVTERWAIEGAPDNAGHPWDGPSEIFSSLLTAAWFGRNKRIRNLALNNLAGILGKEVKKIKL